MEDGIEMPVTGAPDIAKAKAGPKDRRKRKTAQSEDHGKCFRPNAPAPATPAMSAPGTPSSVLSAKLKTPRLASERQARQESSETKYLEKTSVLKILTGESKAGCLYQASRVGKNLENKNDIAAAALLEARCAAGKAALAVVECSLKVPWEQMAVPGKQFRIFLASLSRLPLFTLESLGAWFKNNS